MRLKFSTLISSRALTLVCAVALAPALSAQNRQIELAWLRNAGQTYQGTVAGNGDRLHVACVGNVNRNLDPMNLDVYDDVVIGSPSASLGSAMACGEAWLVYGGPNQSGNKSLGDSDVVTFTGNPNDPLGQGGNAGMSIAGVGDVNQDGYDDFLIGAPFEKVGGNSGAGQAYLIYGGPTLPPSTSISLVGLTAAQGVIFNGGSFCNAGWSVAGLGDVNGDNIPDFAISAPGASTFKGETYIIYGGAPLASPFDLSTMINGANGVTIRGIANNDKSGLSIAKAGDFNGDGLGDLLIGAQNAKPSGKTLAGQAYLVFGEFGTGLGSLINLATLGTLGVTFNGQTAGDQLGSAVAGAGDVDGDGKSEILLGALNANSNSGAVYMVFGGGISSGSLAMGALGNLGVVIPGPTGVTNAHVGAALGGGGDVNRDGLADILIPAQHVDGAVNAGTVYLIYGAPNASWPKSPTPFQLDALGARGVQLNGASASDNAGLDSVAVGGDVDHDGVADMLIGVPGGDVGLASNAGEAVLVKGACRFLQAAGPLGPGDPLLLRAHGAPNKAMEMMFSPTLATGAPLATGLGLYWLGPILFEIPLGTYSSIGEYIPSPQIPIPTGLTGITVYMQFLGNPKPEFSHCDLTYVLKLTFE